MFGRSGILSQDPLGVHAEIEYVGKYGSEKEKKEIPMLQEKAKEYDSVGMKRGT